MSAEPRAALLALLLAPSLTAQGAAWAQGDGISYLFQLRAHRPLGDLRSQTADRVGGGGGFMALLGRSPLRLRIRMDGDDLERRPPASNLRTAGLGLEALYLLPFAPDWEPHVSLGGALQRWEYRPSETPGTPARSFTKAAFRLELGFWAGRHVGASLGLLDSAFESGLRARMAYVGFTFRD